MKSDLLEYLGVVETYTLPYKGEQIGKEFFDAVEKRGESSELIILANDKRYVFR